jgi:hypothetical protein
MNQSLFRAEFAEKIFLQSILGKNIAQKHANILREKKIMQDIPKPIKTLGRDITLQIAKRFTRKPSNIA